MGFHYLSPFSAGDKEPRCYVIAQVTLSCLILFLFFIPSYISLFFLPFHPGKLHDIIIKLGHIESEGGIQSSPIRLWLKMRKDGRMINKLPRVKLPTSDSVMSILFSVWLNQMSDGKARGFVKRGLGVPTSNSERVWSIIRSSLVYYSKTPSTKDLGNTWLNRHVLLPLQSVYGA